MEYKTTRFEHKRVETNNYQGCAMMNYTEEEIPFTRIIEHKHFDPVDCDFTYITHEYPTPYSAKTTDPYYPVNDKENNDIYNKYKELADSEKNIYFGGRLAEYKYYDMHQIIDSALIKIKIFL